jgi:hypothetical protein
MLIEQGGGDVAADAAQGDGDAERRRAYRRQMPFGRAAVLVVGGRDHIVGLADVSVTGAYLRTRLPLDVGDEPLLKLLVLPQRIELRLRSRVVRVNQGPDESHHHTRGVAIHFIDADEEVRARLRGFVNRER